MISYFHAHFCGWKILLDVTNIIFLLVYFMGKHILVLSGSGDYFNILLLVVHFELISHAFKFVSSCQAVN